MTYWSSYLIDQVVVWLFSFFFINIAVIFLSTMSFYILRWNHRLYYKYLIFQPADRFLFHFLKIEITQTNKKLFSNFLHLKSIFLFKRTSIKSMNAAKMDRFFYFKRCIVALEIKFFSTTCWTIYVFYRLKYIKLLNIPNQRRQEQYSQLAYVFIKIRNFVKVSKILFEQLKQDKTMYYIMAMKK